MSPEEFAKTLDMLRETDPDRYLPKAHAPVLVQCARLDSDDNVRACPIVYQIAGGPKQLIWYDDNHHFTSLEALRDRLAWFCLLYTSGVLTRFNQIHIGTMMKL